jgi:hypothetical protein
MVLNSREPHLVCRAIFHLATRPFQHERRDDSQPNSVVAALLRQASRRPIDEVTVALYVSRRPVPLFPAVRTPRYGRVAAAYLTEMFLGLEVIGELGLFWWDLR